MVKRKRWDLKYQQIEHKKGSLSDDRLGNRLKMLWCISFEDFTYKSLKPVQIEINDYQWKHASHRVLAIESNNWFDGIASLRILRCSIDVLRIVKLNQLIEGKFPLLV